MRHANILLVKRYKMATTLKKNSWKDDIKIYFTRTFMNNPIYVFVYFMVLTVSSCCVVCLDYTLSAWMGLHIELENYKTEAQQVPPTIFKRLMMTNVSRNM
jgi:hypothetical protein